MLEPGDVLAKECIFRGRNLGLSFYLCSQDFEKLESEIVGESDLTEEERAVLEITKSYKSSYRAEEYRKRGMSNVDTIKSSLTAKGLLRKNGAITPAGRNAVKSQNGF